MNAPHNRITDLVSGIVIRLNQWSERLEVLAARMRSHELNPKESIGPLFEIRITRAGTDDYIHLSGFVPLDCLIFDAECEAEKLGWMGKIDG